MSFMAKNDLTHSITNGKAGSHEMEWLTKMKWTDTDNLSTKSVLAGRLSLKRKEAYHKKSTTGYSIINWNN